MSTRSAENDVLRVGCSYCGASSGERCWSDVRCVERGPHPERRTFAARVISPASTGGAS